MKSHTLFLFQSSIALFLAAIIFVPLFPISALATTSSHTSPSATITAASLSTLTGERAYLYGTTSSSVSMVRVVVTATSSRTELLKTSSISVSSNDTWSTRLTKVLKDGTYTVYVYDASSSRDRLLTVGTLNVGVTPSSLSVSPITLLAGGVAAAGSNVPVSYLQIVNTGSATTSIKGFWLRQDGSAPTNALTGFSSVDDMGTSFVAISNPTGSLLFKDGRAYVPSTAVLAPGQRKLFTIKAQLAPTSGQYAGLPLVLKVVGIDSVAMTNAVFPIMGTTWILRAY